MCCAELNLEWHGQGEGDLGDALEDTGVSSESGWAEQVVFEHSFKRKALTESTKDQSVTGGDTKKITAAIASVHA